MLVKIKNPSLRAFTFLNPPILDLSNDGMHIYFNPVFFAFIGNSTHNLKSIDFKFRDLTDFVLATMYVNKISEIFKSNRKLPKNEKILFPIKVIIVSSSLPPPG